VDGESELIQRAARDIGAFETLYPAHFEPVYRHATNLGGIRRRPRI
jgi:hypothetical protein